MPPPIAATVATRIALAGSGERGARIAVASVTLVACAALLGATDIHGAALTAGVILPALTSISHAQTATRPATSNG